MKLKLVKMTQLTLPALVGTLALACAGDGNGSSSSTEDPSLEKKGDDTETPIDEDKEMLDDMDVDDMDSTGQGGMGGDSSSNDDEDPVEPIVPEIVSSSPADGDVGFLHDDSFVVKFSVPMDKTSVEANYNSPALPAESVTFSWNEDGTELTIDPNENLEYGTGALPEDIPFYEYTFGIYAEAESAAGEPLTEKLDVTFSTARYLVHYLEPLASLTGSTRTDGYQTTAIHAGDSGQTENEDVVTDWSYIGLISFDLAALPGEVVRVNWAQLGLTQVVNNGSPFEALGGQVDLYDVSFSERSFDSIEPQLSTPFKVLSDSAADSDILHSVSKQVVADFEAGELCQFAMTFAEVTDDDGLADSTQYSDVTLKVSYFIE